MLGREPTSAVYIEMVHALDVRCRMLHFKGNNCLCELKNTLFGNWHG